MTPRDHELIQALVATYEALEAMLKQSPTLRVMVRLNGRLRNAVCRVRAVR